MQEADSIQINPLQKDSLDLVPQETPVRKTDSILAKEPVETIIVKPPPKKFSEKIKPVEEKELLKLESDTNQKKANTKETTEYNFVKLISHRDSAVYQPVGDAIILSQPSEFSTSSKTLEPTERNILREKNSGWILSLALISIIIFIILRVFFAKTVSSIISTSVNIQIAEKLLREKNNIVRRAFLLLNLNFILSISFFTYLISYQYLEVFTSENHFHSFIKVTLYVSGFFLGRFILMQLVSFVFQSQKVFGEYIHNIYLINKNLGIFLLPISFSIVFSPDSFSNALIFINIGLVIIFLLLRIFRSMQIIIKNGVFLFYSILYLCTLEILPLLLGFKLLKLM